MTRSYWHTPIKAFGGQNCSKGWRSKQNRKYRAYVNNELRHERYEMSQYKGKFGNEWDSPRDGKGWCGEYKYIPCPHILRRWGYSTGCNGKHHHCYLYYKELMRK